MNVRKWHTDPKPMWQCRYRREHPGLAGFRTGFPRRPRSAGRIGLALLTRVGTAASTSTCVGKDRPACLQDIFALLPRVVTNVSRLRRAWQPGLVVSSAGGELVGALRLPSDSPLHHGVASRSTWKMAAHDTTCRHASTIQEDDQLRRRKVTWEGGSVGYTTFRRRQELGPQSPAPGTKFGSAMVALTKRVGCVNTNRAMKSKVMKYASINQTGP